jgi:hypothetical protein
MYVSSVSYGSCKNRLGCYTCCNGYTWMFQVHVPNVYLFQTNVVSVLSGCCKSRSGCCIYMHVVSICFKCFKMFHTYVCKCCI